MMVRGESLRQHVDHSTLCYLAPDLYALSLNLATRYSGFQILDFWNGKDDVHISCKLIGRSDIVGGKNTNIMAEAT